MIQRNEASKKSLTTRLQGFAAVATIIRVILVIIWFVKLHLF